MKHIYEEKRASITVETVLILPIFLTALLSFLSFFCLLQTQEELSHAGYEAAKEASLYGFIFNNDTLIDKETHKDAISPSTAEDYQDLLTNNLYQLAGRVTDAVYFKYRIHQLLSDDKINSVYIEDGYQGISFYESELLSSDDKVIIVMQYIFRIPVFDSLLPGISITQKIVIRSFTGHQVQKINTKENENENTLVYIAQTGTVYHTSKDCTHIKLSIKEVSYWEIGALRNESGGSYHVCNVCNEKGINTGKIYVTDYGDRYHVTLTCSGIKRTVISINLSDIGDRRLCSKCSSKK